jgi:hypothetical protein
MAEPIIAKGAQPREALAIFDAIRSGLAGDDVIRVTDWKAFHIDSPRPRVREAFDAVRGEHEIEIERARSDLNEILAALDLRRFRIGERERQIAQSGDRGAPVLR